MKVSSFDVCLFADDTCLLMNGNNSNTLKKNVKTELIKIKHWLKAIKLTWGGTPKSSLKPLSILQRRIIRILTYSEFRCHTSPLCFKLNILKLTDVYKLKLRFIYNIINNKFTGTNN